LFTRQTKAKQTLKRLITFNERKIASQNVVWATGKRNKDHTLQTYHIVRYHEKLEIVIFDDHSKCFYYQEIRKMVYSKHLFRSFQ
jgi:thiamine pyrophosphokinase